MATASDPAKAESAVSSNRWAPLPSGVLERAQAGDAEALGEFFDNYFDRIFATVRRLMGNDDGVEDITQDVFLKIQRAIPRLDPARDPAPWLYTIAANTCRDHWRSGSSRIRQRSVPLDHPAAGALSSGASDPERALLVAEEERRVQRAIDLLPAPLREAIVLHDCEGLGHQEVAVATGIKYAAARKRHSRALIALASLLREDTTP